jgi:SAM-dependent methyltransferase
MQDLSELAPLLLDADSLVRAVASGRQRNTTVPFRRVELRYVDVRAGRHLHVVSNDATQSHTRNLPIGPEAEREVEALLVTPYANWHVETRTETVQVRVSKKGKLLVHRAGRDEAPREADRRHDRTKRRRLDATDPLFRVLGVTSRDGVVKPSRVAKFRQVQDLLAALDPLVDEAIALGPAADLSARRPLRVVDLGCGNAYLTFAAFRYLTEVRSLPVSAVGVDIKAQAREHNTRVAAELGFVDHMTFVESTILGVEVAERPDLVLALHACDTATDEALARAVRWQTPVIVAAPCCHHDIQRQLDTELVPAEYRLMTRHGILKERFADVLTDTLRAAILRLLGYRVEVIEFVDSQHTPRNALIRAVRTGAPPSDETIAAYRQLVADWHVQPALAQLLADQHPEVVAHAADARD